MTTVCVRTIPPQCFFLLMVVSFILLLLLRSPSRTLWSSSFPSWSPSFSWWFVVLPRCDSSSTFRAAVVFLLFFFFLLFLCRCGSYSSSLTKKMTFFCKNLIQIINQYGSYGLSIRMNHKDQQPYGFRMCHTDYWSIWFFLLNIFFYFSSSKFIFFNFLFFNYYLNCFEV